MSVSFTVLQRGSRVVVCLFLAVQISFAQNTSHKPAADTPAATRALLVEKAHALEARGRPDMAIQLWQQILLSDPNNVDALAGVAKDLKLTRSDKAGDAAEHLRKVSPNDPNLARSQGLDSTHAENAALRHAGELARQGHVEDATSHFWFVMGEASQAFNENQFDEASAKYREALDMRPRSPEALNGLAGLLTKQKQYTGAALIYDQLVKVQPNSTDGWRGLFVAYARENQNEVALAVQARFPLPVKVALTNDPEYLRTLAGIYQAENRPADEQKVLAQAMALPFPDNGTNLKADTKLEYAGLLMEANRYSQAAALYGQILTDDAGNAPAWMGLVSAHHEMSQDTEALAELQMMPPAVYETALADPGFLSMLGAIYRQTNQFRVAQDLLERSAKSQMEMPAAIEIQNAWLLFNTDNDRALYPALMRLGSRTGLTSAQREAVQDIWGNWSVRRAAAAMENGNAQHAVDILDAASLAFPDNLTVRKAVAGGYVEVGRAREALALYKTIPMQDANADDFQGAIGAALAASDKNQAALWLRQALERFPRDPSVLILAARFEQARGDNRRAADYYRAALAVMPSDSPTEKLGHELVYPDQDSRARRAVTAADLERLLDPNDGPFPKTTEIPAQPAYGPDSYDGSAPGVLRPPRPSAESPQDSTVQQIPQTAPSPANQNRPPAAPVYVPQSWTRSSISRSPGPRPMYAILQINTRDRLHLHGAPTASGFFRTASFSARAAPALRSAPRMLQSAVTPARNQTVQLSANPPHSQASDAWKGLVFSLMASNRNAEALDEIDKIPPDIRQQLEADVEFVQGEANLYISVSDLPHGAEYLNRVENFYFLRGVDAPPALEVLHAWLLYNANDDNALYPLLQRLDARADLTAAQRDQIQTVWANFAVRRAEFFLDNGYPQRGVQLLQAASQDYPDNLTVRRALAGAYARIGRAEDALALFKTIPMQDANSADYQDAINAAMAATDMAQAEEWLREALARFPADPLILGQAARFEQARGNTQRAADFWRASLAAMPPGPSAATLDAGMAPQGLYSAPAGGSMKNLLDPSIDPPVKGAAAPELPADGPNNFVAHSPAAASPPPVPGQNQSQGSGWVHPPSDIPLPLPEGLNTAAATGEQAKVAGSAPLFISPGAAQPRPSNRTVVVTQGSQQNANIQGVNGKTNAGNQVHTGTNAGPASSSNSSPYRGRMNLPPSEETVGATSENSAPGSPPLPPVWTPNATTGAPHPAPGLRITSKPIGPLAAQAQALIADQVDGQLTQGSA